MEEFLLAAVALMEFLKSSRAGSKAFIVQWCVIKFRRYLAIIEYGGGGWRGFVVVLGGRGGRGWAGFVLELQKVLETFQTSFGDVPKAHHSGEPLGRYSVWPQGEPFCAFDVGGVCAGRGSCQDVLWCTMRYWLDRGGIRWIPRLLGRVMPGSEGQRPWHAWGCGKSLPSFTLVHYML
jgi:hypothetical protein